jgi:hypothetical protein
MSDEIVRGHLTAEEKKQIHHFAEIWKNPIPGRIARRLKRHPATIAWYMIRHGLIQRTVKYHTRLTMRGRNGATRHAWTPAQDQRLLQLRREGRGPRPRPYRAIGEILTREFGVPRNAHNCQVRAVMLAAYDGGEE